MDESGFFIAFSRRVAEAINAHVNDDQKFEVHHLRKIMDVKGRDKSTIIFLAKTLLVFERMGFLSNGTNHSPKQYTKLRSVVFTVDEFARNV